MSFNPNLDFNSIKDNNVGLPIYPVYLNSRVLYEILNFCKSTVPKEALGFLLGKRTFIPEDKSIEFTRVTDWVTGSVKNTHVSASFTTKGLEQANNFLDDKYGKTREKNDELPKIIGIIHSHPFGHEPEFSHTDLDTFLNFPYNAEGNVFILIDPIPNNPFVKVYKIINDSGTGNKTLTHVPWVEYSSIESDLEHTIFIDRNSIVLGENIKEMNNSDGIESYDENDNPYKPPKIEDIGKSKNRKNKDVNMREFF